jgi:hypothetical protein
LRHNPGMSVPTWSWRVALLALCSFGPAQAQDVNKPVYRCPGPPVLYTDALTPAEARERNCRTIEGAPVTVVQGRQPRAAAATPATPAAPGASRPSDRVDPAAQRARDTDARRILTEELRREEERLAALQKDFNGGQPERRGDERNFQKYQDRVAEMKANIARKESDVAALRREIAKLPQ